MKKFLIITAGFIIGFFIFMPKTELFYFIQKQLSKRDIYISADIKSSPLSLNLSNGKIIYHSITGLTFKKASLYPFVVYNELKATDVSIPFEKINIKNAKITYSLFSPYSIDIKAEGNFAEIEGKIDLSKHFIKIYFFNLKKNSLKKMLKKDKKGYYYYEKL